jgi:hypothetical protein
MTGSEQQISALQQSQFPFLDGLIHLFVGGSELHGAKVKNTDDFDIYGSLSGAARTCARSGKTGFLCLEHRWQRASKRAGRH